MVVSHIFFGTIYDGCAWVLLVFFFFFSVIEFFECFVSVSC